MEAAPERRAVVVVLEAGREVARWRIDACPAGDLGVVDLLARLQVAAGHRGWCIRVRDAGDRLRELIELAGLTDVLVHRGPPS